MITETPIYEQPLTLVEIENLRRQLSTESDPKPTHPNNLWVQLKRMLLMIDQANEPQEAPVVQTKPYRFPNFIVTLFTSGGNPSHYGPFDTANEAADWATAYANHPGWTIQSLRRTPAKDS